jgi:Ni,Fe-hydrogenase III small subunit
MASGLLERMFPKAFGRSLWVFHANAGGCNGCDIEVLDALTPRYDVERLGMRLVGSPRHADVLLVCGPVTRPMLEPLRRLYEAVPDPKIVVAIGACAVGGGPWFDTYNVVGGVDRAIPVDMYVPGCPARPEAILHGVAQLLELARKKVEGQSDTQVTAEALARIGRVEPSVPALEPPGGNGRKPTPARSGRDGDRVAGAWESAGDDRVETEAPHADPGTHRR